MVSLRNTFRTVLLSLPLSLCGAMPVAAHARSTSILLQDAIDLALTQNPQQKANVLATKLEAARLREQRARFDASIVSAFRYEKGVSSTQGTQNMLATGFSRGSFEVGAQKPLPWGGQVEITVRTVRSRNAIALPSPSGGRVVQVREYFVQPRLVLRQPILRDAGLGVAKAPIEKARAQLKRAKAELSLQSRRLFRDVTLAYWELKSAQLSLEACSKAKALVVQQIETTKVLIGEGRRAPRDLLALEQELAVKASELEEARNQQALRSSDLRVLMGLPFQESEGLLFEAAQPLQSPCALASPAVSQLAQWVEDNAEIKALRASVQSMRQDLRVADNQKKPALDAYLSAGTRGLSRDAIAQEILQPGSWKKALGSFFDGSSPPRLVDYSVEAGLELKWSMRNRQARARASQARIAFDSALAELVTRRQSIAAQIRQRVKSARSLALRWTMANKSMRLAQENLEVERDRFSAGFGTNDDLLLRMQELYQAQRRLGEIQIDWIKSRSNFAALVGKSHAEGSALARCDA